MSEEYQGRPHITESQIAALRKALAGNDDPKIREFLLELDGVEAKHTGKHGEFCSAYIRAAEEKWAGEEINIDSDAMVSETDPQSETGAGAWVMAWVWVYNDEAGVEPDEGEEVEEVV